MQFLFFQKRGFFTYMFWRRWRGKATRKPGTHVCVACASARALRMRIAMPNKKQQCVCVGYRWQWHWQWRNTHREIRGGGASLLPLLLLLQSETFGWLHVAHQGATTHAVGHQVGISPLVQKTKKESNNLPWNISHFLTCFYFVSKMKTKQKVCTFLSQW